MSALRCALKKNHIQSAQFEVLILANQFLKNKMAQKQTPNQIDLSGVLARLVDKLDSMDNQVKWLTTNVQIFIKEQRQRAEDRVKDEQQKSKIIQETQGQSKKQASTLCKELQCKQEEEKVTSQNNVQKKREILSGEKVKIENEVQKNEEKQSQQQKNQNQQSQNQLDGMRQVLTKKIQNSIRKNQRDMKSPKTKKIIQKIQLPAQKPCTSLAFNKSVEVQDKYASPSTDIVLMESQRFIKQEMEKKLIKWIQQNYTPESIIYLNEVRIKALEFAPSFRPTISWFHEFRKRYLKHNVVIMN